MVRKMMAIVLCLGMLLSFAAAESREKLFCGDYAYVLLEDGTAEVVQYCGVSQDIVIPAEMDGHPVTSIGAISANTLNYRNYTPGTYMSVEDLKQLFQSMFYGFPQEDIDGGSFGRPARNIPEGSRVEMIRFMARKLGWENGWTVLSDYMTDAKTAQQVPRDVRQTRENRVAGIRAKIDEAQEKIAQLEAMISDPDTSEGKAKAIRSSIERTAEEMVSLETELEKIDQAVYMLDSDVMEIWKEQTGLSTSDDDVPALAALWMEAYQPLFYDDAVPEGFNTGMAFIISDEGLGFSNADAVYFDRLYRSASVVAAQMENDAKTFIRLEDVLHVVVVPYPLHSVVIPDGVKRIGPSAFAGSTELTDVTIPDSVTEIGVFAFMGCPNLYSMRIPAGVTSIGTMALPGSAMSPDTPNGQYSMTVTAGSYAEQYCIEYHIPYTYAEE